MFELLAQLWTAVEPVVIPTAVTVLTATVATVFTPTTSSIKIINIVLKIINIVAGNILKNKNKDA